MWLSEKYVGGSCSLTLRFITSRPLNPRAGPSQDPRIWEHLIRYPLWPAAGLCGGGVQVLWGLGRSPRNIASVADPVWQAAAASAAPTGRVPCDGAVETPVHVRSRGKARQCPLCSTSTRHASPSQAPGLLMADEPAATSMEQFHSVISFCSRRGVPAPRLPFRYEWGTQAFTVQFSSGNKLGWFPAKTVWWICPENQILDHLVMTS